MFKSNQFQIRVKYFRRVIIVLSLTETFFLGRTIILVHVFLSNFNLLCGAIWKYSRFFNLFFYLQYPQFLAILYQKVLKFKKEILQSSINQKIAFLPIYLLEIFSTVISFQHFLNQ